jgi:hypothetical protein
MLISTFVRTAWSGRVSERDVLQPDVAVPRAREGHAGRGGDGGLTVKEFENTGSGADAFHHCRRDAQKSRERWERDGQEEGKGESWEEVKRKKNVERRRKRKWRSRPVKKPVRPLTEPPTYLSNGKERAM